MDALREMGFTFGRSDGAFYIWANVSSLGWDSSVQLAYELLRDAGVLIFPGAGFGEGWDSYMRFTLLQPEPVILEALDRMDRVLAKK